MFEELEEALSLQARVREAHVKGRWRGPAEPLWTFVRPIYGSPAYEQRAEEERLAESRQAVEYVHGRGNFVCGPSRPAANSQ